MAAKRPTSGKPAVNQPSPPKPAREASLAMATADSLSTAVPPDRDGSAARTRKGDAKPVGSRSPTAKGPAGVAHAEAPSVPDAIVAKAVHDVLHPETASPRIRPVSSAAEPASASPGLDALVDPPAPSAPDVDQLASNMARWLEQSHQLAATFAPPGTTAPRKAEVADAVEVFGQVVEHWFADPARLMQAQASLTAGVMELWSRTANRALRPSPASAPSADMPPADKRFRDPAWRENPVFDFLHKAFLLGSDWANDLVDKTEGLDAPTRDKARFYLRQVTSALSPSNFVPTNPELLRETLAENGGNLLRGLKMLAEDLEAGKGQLRIRHTDTSSFALGVNMALTPGKVVFRNDLMELLQYSPSTNEVLARPLLIVPPWINKFYVLDLNPEKSFIRWAVSQGLTVFVISWVNPDERHAEKDFESYMREGILTALDQIEDITGERQSSAIGYCVGGTLLAVTLAHMAAEEDARIASATLFTAQVDFTHAGDLKVFADKEQIALIEAQMRQQGYLKGSHMAQAFNMLRPEELIWSYWVNNYLRGKEPPAFDLLAWNSDSTRMPAANHAFYLRNCYLENNLAKGEMTIAGRKLDTRAITVPIYNLATREDHIAPALSVFEGSKMLGGQVRYVLSGSGHVAGVVNPPSKTKYGYTTGPEPSGGFYTWLERATTHPGSWWPDWFAWVEAQAPARVPARTPGGGRDTLGDAPGTYVTIKA